MYKRYKEIAEVANEIRTGEGYKDLEHLSSLLNKQSKLRTDAARPRVEEKAQNVYDACSAKCLREGKSARIAIDKAEDAREAVIEGWEDKLKKDIFTQLAGIVAQFEE